jgi:signal transduction histidine kinase
MATAVLTLPLRTQEEVLLTRRRARDLAALLQFSPAEQIGLSTAAWEVARLAERRGEAELAVVEAPPSVAVRITVSGIPPSVLNGSTDGPHLNLDALGRLVDEVEASDRNGATVVRLSAAAGSDAWVPGIDELELVLASLTRHDTGGGGPGLLDELRQQNFELLTTLATLREREAELTTLNTELGDTNLAVTALYSELEQQTRELRQRAEDNSRFLSEVAHELRTPLYAVRGMTEAILRDYGDALHEGIRDDVTLIDGAMLEALDLVNDHLDLAKMAAGRTIVRLSHVDVAELFKTLRAIVTRLPANSGVGLIFDDVSAVPPLRTDAFKLSQILRNLAVNALKFTVEGHVRISATPVDGGQRVRFEVADTGPGLSAEEQEMVFEAFVQLGSERQGGVRGSGLGLPLTRRLAAVLGGEVGVTSTPGEGATFFATIPVSHPPDVEGVEVVDSDAAADRPA